MIPKFSKMTYEIFNDWLTVGVAYLLANATRFIISTDNQTALNALYALWVPNWALWINPDTRTGTVTKKRRAQRKALIALLITIFRDIPESVFTETDASTLQISLTRDTRTPAQVMDHPPTGTLEVRGVGLYSIRFQEPTTPESRALPEGQVFIFMQGYVGAAGISPASVQWSNFYFITRFTYDLAFAEPFRGQTAYYRWCYVNTRGEISPMSDVLSFVIG